MKIQVKKLVFGVGAQGLKMSSKYA